jgi:hypothetical protein
MDKSLYIVVHHHRFGEDFFLVKCDGPPNLDEVINIFNIHFESGREDEWMDYREYLGEIEEVLSFSFDTPEETCKVKEI